MRVLPVLGIGTASLLSAIGGSSMCAARAARACGKGDEAKGAGIVGGVMVAAGGLLAAVSGVELAKERDRQPEAPAPAWPDDDDDGDDAADMWRSFHWGREPSERWREELPDYSELAVLGRLKAVLYETAKGDERAFEWWHEFTAPEPF